VGSTVNAVTAGKLAPGDFLYLADVQSTICVDDVAERGDHVIVRWCGGSIRLARDAPVSANLPEHVEDAAAVH
jgi:hypothetical protein